MPTKNEIAEQIQRQKILVQDDVRRRYLKELSEHTSRDTIIYASSFTTRKLLNVPGVLVSIMPEDIQGFMSALHGLSGKKLDLILHSPGGSLEVADQLVQYLRAKYEHIRAIVPQNAMSAATMIACACDEIVMGKHSALGPIDPQITFQSNQGHFTAPAQSILDDFAEAKEEVLKDPRTAPLWITKLQSYPQGFLRICHDTIQLSKDKVTEWLDAYMFRNEPEKRGRAIADWLGDARIHKTHGRPIMSKTAKEKGLKVVDIESDQDLQEKVLSVFHATNVTFETTHCMKLIENQNGKGTYLNIDLQTK
jgi:ATP-dependent protease ClpP protease subunit